MLSRNIYTVARHTFAVYAPESVEIAMLIPSLQPFMETNGESLSPLFTLTLSDELPVAGNAVLLTDFEWEEAVCAVYTTAGGYELQITPKGGEECRRMSMNKDCTRAVVEFKSDEATDRFTVGNFLMMLYAFATAPYDTLMFHSSVIRNASDGYLFLGKSGTGKSTHSRLWLQHIPGSELLNDDNPIVRIHADGEAWVYGSPWSGKTPCYRNESVKIKGVVRLQQAPHNQIKREKSARAFASLLPSCSCLRQEKRLFDAVCEAVGKLAVAVPVYNLECLPDAAAAELCFSTLSNQ